MSSSSVTEKELTCSICTDLLYDPVTFLDCLHTNCGSCAKAWFQSLSNNAANAPVHSSSAPPNVAKYTCPVCRAVVRATKHNATLQSLVDDFVARNPDKDRTQEEKDAVRKIYTPGSGVLPGEIGTASSPRAPSLPNRAPVPIRRPVPPPMPLSAWPTPPRIQPPPQQRRGSSAARPTPSSWVESLVHVTEQTCFHCQKRIDFAARCCCPECNILICSSCYRDGRRCRTQDTNHALIPNKLQLNPRHIQSGVFCDICESWCDNNGNERNAFFWACEICDNGNWSVCRACVSKGNACTHELKLYSNQRQPTRGAIRGTLGQPNFHVYSQLVRAPGNANMDLNTRLNAYGYVRATGFQIQCDDCLGVVPPDHSYLHCIECLDGHWDMCIDCWYTLADQLGTSDEEVFRCRAGHFMSLLSQGGQTGTHKTIQDAPHPPPDFVSQSPLNSNSDNHGRQTSAGPKTAVAVKSHWPNASESNIDTVWRQETPGVRARDYSGLLAFPDRAEITNVWVAFTEGEGEARVEYLWGWYSGIGGLFPGDCVRFTG